ncbi:HNH endonuclease [Terrihabitans rhizophilus]|uniref:HNH endonuclease n=1 Tax=Terrihabitans rhizophilus TaxID=3092662 RepID=A0ABU4RQH0_9HYPH|nr:HNH endonuclease [Terrihabitans sp. PJ23]MDX6806428.1 HNH endonuclease [Terrihabitans sp. PJ23]
MPIRAPRLCLCGKVVASGTRCECQLKRDTERKARFDAKRPSSRERGYDSKWQRERAAYLQAHPVCVRCPEPSKVVDHITPHRGDLKLFWRRSNWQPLCVSCHSRAKQSEERRAGPMTRPDRSPETTA